MVIMETEVNLPPNSAFFFNYKALKILLGDRLEK